MQIVLFPEEKQTLTVYANGTGGWTVPDQITVHLNDRTFGIDPRSLECAIDPTSVSPEVIGALNTETLGKLFPGLPADRAPALIESLCAFLRDLASRGVQAMSPPPFPVVDLQRYEELKKGPPTWYVWNAEPGMRVGPGPMAPIILVSAISVCLIASGVGWYYIRRSGTAKTIRVQTL
jgi:hypothetical protein